MSTLARRPYDAARLDVVLGAAVPDLPIVVLGAGDAAPYLGERGAKVLEVTDLSAVPDGSAGGAVAMGAFAKLDRAGVEQSLRELARVLAPGAPLLFTLLDGDWKRPQVEELLASLGGFDHARVEGRRPYPFEDGPWRIFASARRAGGL